MFTSFLKIFFVIDEVARAPSGMFFLILVMCLQNLQVVKEQRGIDVRNGPRVCLVDTSVYALRRQALISVFSGDISMSKAQDTLLN